MPLEARKIEKFLIESFCSLSKKCYICKQFPLQKELQLHKNLDIVIRVRPAK